MNLRLKFLSFLGILPVIVLAQQADKRDSKGLSLSFSMAPSMISIPTNYHSDRTFCLTNFYSTISLRSHNRLSFSTGLHWLQKKDVNHSGVISEFGYSGPKTNTFNYNVIGVPARLNFNINKPNDKINFYIKTELSNSLIINYTDEYPNYLGVFESNTDVAYGLSIGFGLGLDIKLKNRLSIFVEPVKYYSITGLFNPTRFSDCQMGFKLKL